MERLTGPERLNGGRVHTDLDDSSYDFYSLQSATGGNPKSLHMSARTKKAAGAARRRWAAFSRIRCAAGAMSLGLLFLGASGCQGPDGLSRFHYGSGADCAADKGPKPLSLQVSLDPLRHEFDRFSDVPRVVALMPHMGCERGAEILRQDVLDAYPNSDLRLFVIWQDLARTEGAAAAAGRATLFLQDPRVTAFHDCSGLAGRAFARDKLPIAEAREVFLFYPAGTTWPQPGGSRLDAKAPLGDLGRGSRPRTGAGFASSFTSFDVGAAATDRAAGARKTSGVTEVTPHTDNWVHHLGRVAPDKFCTPQELPSEMRKAVALLLAKADARRLRLARR